MTNPLRGEVPLDVEGEPYVLLLDVNALCEVEALTGETMQDIVGQIQTGGMSLTLMRAMLCAGLHHHHPEVSLKDAGRIATDVGMSALGPKLVEAFAAAWPKADKAAKEGAPANPRRKRGTPGTG